MVVIDVLATKMKLADAMEKKGITKRDLQNEVGYSSVQSVYKWLDMTGSTLPRIDALVEIADILDLSLDELIVTRMIAV